MNAAQLVTEVQALIDRYGFDAVSQTVEYINNLPMTSKFRADGEVATLTQSQQDRLWRIANSEYILGVGVGKLSAIKELRAMSGIGLRAAKDIIEAHFMKKVD